MAYDCLIQRPPARVWESLEAPYKQDFDKATHSQFCFGSFYALGNYAKEGEETAEAEFEEVFGDDDGKEWLCLMATVYWDTFKGAPLNPNQEIEKWAKGVCAW